MNTYSNLKVIALLLVFLTSCNKNDFKEPTVKTNLNYLTIKSANFKSELINDYAKILAISLSDEIKIAIKEEAHKRFDGDYDILVSNFEEILIKNKSVKELLKENREDVAKNIRLNTNISSEDFFKQIALEFPNLQISVPIHCKDWDPKNFTPPVAYLPFDYNEKDRKEITAYDQYGNILKLDPVNEPDFPVIVISISERVDRNKMLISKESSLTLNDGVLVLKSAPATPTGLTVMHGNPLSLILHWNDSDNETSYEIWRMAFDETQFWHHWNTGQNINTFINEYAWDGKKYWYQVRAVNNDGYSGFSNIVATTSSARYDGEWLKIKGMKFTSSYLSYVESWVSGAPEIRLRAVQGLQGGANVIFTSGILEPNDRDDIKDKWWYSEVPIVQWYTATLGTVINLDWREEDPWPSGTVSFDITGSYEDKNEDGTIKYGGTITINNDHGDSHIGSNLVHYWDVKSQIYDYTGFVYQLVY